MVPAGSIQCPQSMLLSDPNAILSRPTGNATAGIRAGGKRHRLRYLQSGYRDGVLQQAALRKPGSRYVD